MPPQFELSSKVSLKNKQLEEIMLDFFRNDLIPKNHPNYVVQEDGSVSDKTTSRGAACKLVLSAFAVILGRMDASLNPQLRYDRHVPEIKAIDAKVRESRAILKGYPHEPKKPKK
jgi:hypothetical protein